MREILKIQKMKLEKKTPFNQKKKSNTTSEKKGEIFLSVIKLIVILLCVYRFMV